MAVAAAVPTATTDTEDRPKKPPRRRTTKNPATQMREMLVVSRRHGLVFEQAWDSAWRRIIWPHDTEHRRDWKERLEEDMEVYSSAYDRRGNVNRGLVAIYSLMVTAADAEERLIA